jgi:hypothetical protein
MKLTDSTNEQLEAALHNNRVLADYLGNQRDNVVMDIALILEEKKRRAEVKQYDDRK